MSNLKPLICHSFPSLALLSLQCVKSPSERHEVQMDTQRLLTCVSILSHFLGVSGDLMMTSVEYSPGHFPGLEGSKRVGRACLPPQLSFCTIKIFPEMISHVEGYLKCYSDSTRR